MGWKTLAAVFVLILIALSGCTEKFAGEADNNTGAQANENSEAPSDEIPTPQAPQGDESQPPNLPF